MKKFIVIIIILIIIFIGMIIYKNTSIKSSITIQEIEQIENYINQIYLEKEIIGEPIPYFENINQADEKWIWEVVEKNIEDDKITYEKLQEKAQEIFGEDFTKKFPKEGTEYLKYNQTENIYEIEENEIDEQGTLFLINQIERTKQGYEIELVEYLEDYSPILEENSENYIIIRNLEQEEISRASGSNQEEEIDIVKRNIDKFSKKKILLKEKDGKIYIGKVGTGTTLPQ